ncbi:hypothetical protein [Mesoterricola silvestris]|uniref:Uncharacterized protein n=1 Tax=Mesoterricola silvestris TaxID=2927979 RepID=A0AA48KBG5_9BACT|nr:hypothetical protein [Mesoterricola silvestris]BDU72503.1 hypothetical protein METEAL_16770 [Mesoterricola silvestris]
MDLIERYVQAVRFWLPRENQQDISAELAEDLRCQKEDKEAELGRPLDESETAAMLARAGNPLAVAGQYLQEKPLLDPALSMIFRLVVKVVLLWILLPLFAVAAVPSALLSDHPLASMVETLGSYAFSSIFALGCITLAFILVASQERTRGWDPLKLPPLRRQGPKPVPRAGSFAEVVFGLLFVAWWVEGFGHLPIAWSSRLGAVYAGGPLWTTLHAQLFWPVLALNLAGIAVGALCLARPHLATFRMGYGILADACAAAICAMAIQANRPAIHQALGALRDLGRTRDVSAMVDGFAASVLVIIAVVSVVSFLSRIFRLIQTSPERR